jgi:hypothetical protein
VTSHLRIPSRTPSQSSPHTTTRRVDAGYDVFRTHLPRTVNAEIDSRHHNLNSAKAFRRSTLVRIPRKPLHVGRRVGSVLRGRRANCGLLRVPKLRDGVGIELQQTPEPRNHPSAARGVPPPSLSACNSTSIEYLRSRKARRVLREWLGRGQGDGAPTVWNR